MVKWATGVILKKRGWGFVARGVCLLAAAWHAGLCEAGSPAPGGSIAYLASDLRIPFWEIMRKGAQAQAQRQGMSLEAYSAQNDPKAELENMVKALAGHPKAVVISPVNSSTAVTLLAMAKRARVPAVVADVGSDSGDYVSYISSENAQGARELGFALADQMEQRGWGGGSVGIVAIPQKRKNGRLRTAGFLEAMEQRGIRVAGLLQQETFEARETYAHVSKLLGDKSVRAIWLQGSDRYKAAQEAIADAGKAGQVLLACFDAEPEFPRMIAEGELAAAAMQQPYAIGEQAAQAAAQAASGRAPAKEMAVGVLVVRKENVGELMPAIRRNVLGQAK